MSQTEKKPMGRPRSVKSHQAILQATLEILAEVGYEGKNSSDNGISISGKASGTIMALSGRIISD
jgi:hypothetical protein